MSARILAVDDEPDLQQLLRQTFRRQVKHDGWTFAYARDGEEALELLRTSDFDVVLTDLNMPRMDGLTLLGHLAEDSRPLRAVVVSAYGDLANIRTAMNRGAFDFVTKPINLGDLTATLEKAIAAAKAHREALAVRRQLATTEQQLAVASELQAVKSHFFADLSHEFRTPLTLILGPLQDALRGHPFGDEEVAVMHRHAARLKRLIDQLLDLSKVEAARLTLRASELDIVPFLADLVQSFAPAAERKRIALRFDAPDAAVTLYVELDKLEKIVVNLLSNALKFTPEGGAVRVRLVPEDDAVALVVRDSGPGIHADALPHLFDRFYQVEATTPGGIGTGIGLALTKALVELHGGTLAVESEEGFGSTFTVRLRRGRSHLHPGDLADAPVPHEATHIEDRLAVASGDGQPDVAVESIVDNAVADDPVADDPVADDAPLVLVVEDHTDVRAYLRRQLATRYRVVEASDGQAGLVKAQASTPDLIVSDVMMPGLSGFDLCHAVKSDDALNHIPVILLTALADEEHVLEGLEHGADAYLPKPFNAQELLQRAENLIEIRRLLRERFRGTYRVQATQIDALSADEVFLGQVQAFVEANMHKRSFDVASVADAVGLSPRQLRRKIRALTGLSPAGFVRMLRLERAAQLLAQRTGTVSEVAYDVGFQDTKHFSQLFRQVHGVLPSHYTGA